MAGTRGPEFTREQLQRLSLLELQMEQEAALQGRPIGSINRKIMELANEHDSLRPNALSAAWRRRVREASRALSEEG